MPVRCRRRLLTTEQPANPLEPTAPTKKTRFSARARVPKSAKGERHAERCDGARAAGCGRSGGPADAVGSIWSRTGPRPRRRRKSPRRRLLRRRAWRNKRRIRATPCRSRRSSLRRFRRYRELPRPRRMRRRRSQPQQSNHRSNSVEYRKFDGAGLGDAPRPAVFWALLS